MPWSIESAVIGSWHDHYQLEAEKGELFLIEQYQRGFKFPLFQKEAINWLLIYQIIKTNKQQNERNVVDAWFILQ